MTPELIELRQAQVTIEHEAVWTFETIAARSSQLKKLAQTSASQHRQNRDHLNELLKNAAADVPTPLPGYRWDELNNDAKMQAASQDILARLSSLELAVIARTTGSARSASVLNLNNMSISAVRWGGTAQAFPGLTSR